MNTLMIILIIAPQSWTSSKQPRQISMIHTDISTCLEVKRKYSVKEKYIQVECVRENK